ncbi:reverse transcriptase domain-containing protein [Chitinophagaceae bacterium LWZ2-11]
MPYTYEDVHEAYVKLKTYIYYDSTNLFMRKQLAIFETDLVDDYDFLNRILEYNDFEKKYKVKIDKEEKKQLSTYERKLRVFVEALNTFHANPEYFKTFLSRIKAKFLPKKIDKGENKNSRIITNKRTADKYTIERSTVFIDAPIEIHLLTVLWILRKGVSLDKDLFDGCLGNRLILNKEKNKVVQGSGLFKPYPKQYQKWRDDAVKAAHEQLEKNEDVLIVNLDIRDFFYSVRIPKDEIIMGEKKMPSHLRNMYDIFGSIHEVFTNQLSGYETPYDFKREVTGDNDELKTYILPIGLLSSFVIANNYLKDFDKRIIKHERPIYYGRYVDDILLVISNPLLPEDIDKNVKELNFNYGKYLYWINVEKGYENEAISEKNFESLSDVEQYVLINFHPFISLIDKPSFLSSKEEDSDDSRVFKINGFERLYCQSDKTLLYYFDKDESALVIDKLKRDLEEKSSEFRNYSDAEDAEDFEESAYHLLYDGTDGKIRTLKDYKEDKFGLTVYFSKRIFNSLRKADKISNAEADKIVRFFQGSNALTLYTLWERIFVFLLVNNKAQAYVQFYLNCCEAIKRVEPPTAIRKLINKDTFQAHILEHLDSSNELALSLYPKFLSDVQKAKRTYHFSFNALKNELEFYRAKYTPTDEKSFFISRYRRSNLIRHHYVAQPLLSYTTTDKKDYKNYTDLKIQFQ